MRKTCLLCERVSSDGNLFCQESYCPSEMSPYILDYGEWLGDIEIIRLITVLRSSSLYEVRYNQQKALLKIAHPGTEHTERLKREAIFLRDTSNDKTFDSTLPRLLPPYINTTIAQDPYGRAMLGGQLLYFCLFQHFQGDTLRDVLVNHPQLWVFHVGWITTSIASAVAFMHSKSRLHYGLTPQSVLVRFSDDLPAPQTLLIDLGLVSDRKTLATEWYPACVPPAYTAPELIATVPRPNYATDVYGIGLVLYEMLIGEPAFSFRLRSDADVYEAVTSNTRVPMNRIGDVKEVADMAMAASHPVPEQRPQNAADMAESLLKIFGTAPTQRRRRGPSPRTAFLVTAVLLVVAFVVTFGVTMLNAIQTAR